MATIIDALVMTLGLDASDYQKNSQKVKKENQSFTEEQKKQLDKIEKQAKQALSAISNVQKGILGLFTAVAGATGVGQFLTQVNQAEAALGRLSSHTGQSTEELHKWSNMAAIVGGSAEDMQAGVSNLQQQLTDLKYKGEMGGTVTFLAQMGVAVANTNGEMRKQSDIMLDLSDRAKEMKKEDFYNLASSSGMTDSQIDVIMKGRTELEKMLIAQEENALVTKEQAEEARKLQAEWELMKQSIFSAGVRILHDLMPIIQAVAEGLRTFFNFLQKHRGIIYGFFIVLAAVMLPVLITTTAIVAQFLLMAAPIIAISAAIGLLIDDFITWKEGGESLFGTFYDWFDKLIDKVTGFGDLLRAIFTGDWVKVAQIVQSFIGGDEPKDITLKADQKEKNHSPPLKQTPKDSKALADFANNAETPAIGAKAKQFTQTIKDVRDSVGTMILGTTKMASEVQQGMQSNIDGDYVSHPPIKSNAKGDKQIDFIKKYWGAAVKIASALDTKPEFILAQFAGETDWGKKVINGTGYNLGNIKAGSSWKGGTVKAYDPIEKSYDPYRVYSSSEEFAADYIKLISKKKIYKNVAGSQTAQKFYSELKSAGYATDVDYVSKNLKMVDSVTMRMDMSKLKKNSKPVPTTNQAQAAISNTTSTGNNTNIETHIGEVKVFTAATDANGIAGDISNVLAFNINTYAFDSGMS